MTRAKSPSIPSRFPHLRQFVGGYLHQDFVEEHGTPAAALEAFLRDADRDERAAFIAEAAAFLAEADGLAWSDVRAAFDALGGAWLPRSRAALSALLRASTAAPSSRARPAARRHDDQ
jgi:hypothetical protein